MKPVYVDGPLLGERFDTDEASVQAWTPGQDLAGDTVTYQFREVGFASGCKAVVVRVGWCGEGEPDAETICRALFRDDVMDRADVITVTPAVDLTMDLTA